MAEEAIKQRLRRAKTAAIRNAQKAGYTVIESDNSPFCFQAIRPKEIRMVHVAIKTPSKQDIDSIKNFSASGNITKEIWLRKKDNGFDMREVI